MAFGGLLRRPGGPPRNDVMARPKAEAIPQPTAQRLDDLFAVDVRGLAALRIGIAAVVLFDVARDLPQVRAFYSDEGVFPRAMFFQYAVPWRLSLHVINGTAAVQAALLLLEAATAFALLIGFKTRLASIATWILVTSLQARNEFVFDVGDQLLRLLLLWTMFVPLGTVLSVDARRGGVSPDAPQAIRNMGTCGLMVQVLFMFGLAGVYKLRSPMWLHGAGVYYAFGQGEIQTALGGWLLGHPLWLIPANYAVMALELAGGFLLLSPVLTRRVRSVALAGIALMSLGFGLCLGLGPVPWIIGVALIPFISPENWDRIAAGGWGTRLFGPLESHPRWGRVQSGSSRFAQVVCAGLLAFGFVSGLSTATHGFVVPESIEWVGNLSTAEQDWGMFFRPNPHTTWWATDARLADGRHVDLHTGQPPATGEPGDLLASIGGWRWRSFMWDLSETKVGDRNVLAQPLADYLCRRWNESHDESGRAVEVEVLILRRPIRPWAEVLQGLAGASAGIERESLGHYECSPPEPMVE
jgi:hypothetical protein